MHVPVTNLALISKSPVDILQFGNLVNEADQSVQLP